jgi:hypothetical protein
MKTIGKHVSCSLLSSQIQTHIHSRIPECQPAIPHFHHHAKLDNLVHRLDVSLIDHEKREGSKDTRKLGKWEKFMSGGSDCADDQICNKRRCTRQMKFLKNHESCATKQYRMKSSTWPNLPFRGYMSLFHVQHTVFERSSIRPITENMC